VLTSTMAIVGTGVDICEVERVRAAIDRFGQRFLKRVFTQAEREYCESKRNRIERYAARFAAKEAAMKAIGTGLRQGVSWQDFEVGRETGGRPTILIKGKGAEFAAKLGMKRASLSITHTESQAMAQVIIES
jgi:holo-[acyl-carrier protein] synthase